MSAFTILAILTGWLIGGAVVGCFVGAVIAHRDRT